MIDAAWDGVIAPMLKARFGSVDAATIRSARAYAYGGAVMPDMGYYPFGSHFFTNLLHYTRSGDFVETLIRDARDVNEYAFALGALAHYVADSTGHPLGVNRAVPVEYPELRARFGDEVTYIEDPKRHIMVEFAFDVVQAANGAYLPQAYHDFIGFQVATDLAAGSIRARLRLGCARDAEDRPVQGAGVQDADRRSGAPLHRQLQDVARSLPGAARRGP
jgi:hypothetical protein